MCYQELKISKDYLIYLRKLSYSITIKGKGKVFYGQVHPSGESTTTEGGVN